MFGKLKKTAIIGGLGLGVILASFTFAEQPEKETFYLSDDEMVWDVLEKLGKIKTNQVNTEIEGVSAEKGRDIIYNGASAKQNGKGRTSNQSAYFKCTACHNNEKEFKDLSDVSAANRLDYAGENDLPYLQGSSFYGIINRVTYYNDDYQKKYGHIPIIKASNTDIRTAIQLCATQCSQGRELEDWEIESVLAYYWSIGIKVKDLNLSDEEKKSIEAVVNQDGDKATALQMIEGRYLNKSPAHFTEDPAYQMIADAKIDVNRYKKGKLVYEKSCLHCHEGRRYSFFALDDSRLSFSNLLKRAKAGNEGATQKLIRHGTWPLAGKKAYMPLYPTEKMSNDQLLDLFVYIENRAEGKKLSE